MGDGIAFPSGRQTAGVLVVQPDVADLIVLIIQDGDRVLLLQELHSQLHRKDEGRVIRRAARGGVRKRYADQRFLGALPYDRRRFGLQDRIVVIADRPRRIAAAGGKTLEISYWTRRR